jgi:hypothetical protein
VSIVSQFSKRSVSFPVQAGLLLIVAALLTACGAEPAPVDSAPARLASTSPQNLDKGDGADLPVVVVTASRKAKGQI